MIYSSWYKAISCNLHIEANFFQFTLIYTPFYALEIKGFELSLGFKPSAIEQGAFEF